MNWYKDRFKSLEDQYDVSAERGHARLAGEAKQLGQQFGQDMAGVRGDISGYERDARSRGDVSTLRGQQVGIGARLGGLADQALDPTSTEALQEQEMLAGVAEQQRNAANQAAQEQPPGWPHRDVTRAVAC